METMNEPVRLMEIERELASSGKEEALARYDGILSRLDKRLEGALKEGLAPDEYEDATALKEANLVARKILRLTVRGDGKA